MIDRQLPALALGMHRQASLFLHLSIQSNLSVASRYSTHHALYLCAEVQHTVVVAYSWLILIKY